MPRKSNIIRFAIVISLCGILILPACRTRKHGCEDCPTFGKNKGGAEMPLKTNS
jgi:hypothetical protein